jgi:hypothetical protein
MLSFIDETSFAVSIFVAVALSLDHQAHHQGDIVSIFVHISSIF